MEFNRQETSRSIFPLIVLAFLFVFSLLINTIIFKYKAINKKLSNDVINVGRRTLADWRMSEDWGAGMISYESEGAQHFKIRHGHLNHEGFFQRDANEEMDEWAEEDEYGYVEKGLADLIRSGEVMKGGSAIVILFYNQTGRRQQQVDSLTNSLRTLPFLFGDDPDALAPVLIFCEKRNEFNSKNKAQLALSTNRPIVFPLFEKDAAKDSKTTKLLKNDVTDNNPSNDPWIAKLQKHPALRHFDVIIKLNTNFCFRTFNDQLPGFDNDLSYHGAYGGFTNVTVDEHIAIFDFVKHYITSHKIKPKNLKMWDHFIATSDKKQHLPYFSTNFEIIRKKAFSERRDILNWYRFLHSKGTDLFQFTIEKEKMKGILQFITIAIFMNDNEIRTTNALGFRFGSQECAPEDIETSLAYLY